MIRKSAAFSFIFIILFTFLSSVAFAQPQLPDIAGAEDKGVIVLTWQCQYDGVKSIIVQRSSDSLHNFSTVGYVKNVKKGVQAFVDGHPLPGKNWYQLTIVFSSDLNWTSNKIKLVVDSSTLMNQNVVLPPNDSLQKLLVTTESNGRKTVKSKSGIVVTIDSSGKKDGVRATSSVDTTGNAASPNSADSISRKVHHISISLDADPTAVNPYTFIKSHYVFTNPLTGHVNMELPEVTSHHYSVKFFDDKEKQIMEVPHITASPIIIDKRNFQKKGIYKFELRKDRAILETGYITIY